MKILVAKPNNNTGSWCSLTRWMGTKLFNEQRVKITRWIENFESWGRKVKNFVGSHQSKKWRWGYVPKSSIWLNNWISGRLPQINPHTKKDYSLFLSFYNGETSKTSFFITYFYTLCYNSKGTVLLGKEILTEKN